MPVLMMRMIMMPMTGVVILLVIGGGFVTVIVRPTDRC